MNRNQSIPANSSLAPVLIFGALIFLAVKWVFSGGEDPEKQQETESKKAPAESHGKSVSFPPNSGGNSVQNPHLPADSGRNFGVPPSVIPAISVQSAPKAVVPVSLAIIPSKKNVKLPPPKPFKRKIVRRENLAAIFRSGTLTLTRNDAVSALVGLGFGKSAAYEAISPNGRFGDLLHFAKDGTVSSTTK